MAELLPAPLAELAREGGPVLLAILALSVAGWSLVLRLLLERAPPPASPPEPDPARRALADLDAHERLAEGRATLRLVALLAGAAPLFGLLGTVLGMMDTFSFLGRAEVPRADALAGGVSRALVTTQAGLVVAILLLAGHALLGRRLRALERALEPEA